MKALTAAVDQGDGPRSDPALGRPPEVRLVLGGGRVVHLRAVLARLCYAYFVLNRSPLGKGFVRREVLPRVAPGWPSAIRVSMLNGPVVDFGWGEVIGCSFAISGSFEPAELAAISRLALPGTCVIDVGANVGLMALVAAAAVGPTGSVVAVEPLPVNLVRLAENIQKNRYPWVQIEPAAAGSETGTATLHVTRDSAYPSLKTPAGGHRVIDAIAVSLRTIDNVWRERGMPRVSLLKVDVEGYELDVLRGAATLLKTCRPVVLAESHEEHLGAVDALLAQHGYQMDTPPGFSPWNHLWVAGDHHDGGTR